MTPRQLLYPILGVVFGVLAFFFFAFLAGCGSSEASGSGCVGEVTDKYTEYKPGIGITSGNVTVPTGSTVYYIAIKKSDGTFCAKKLKKESWLAVQEGETYETG